MNMLVMLREMRDFGGKPRTIGLSDATVEQFAKSDAQLRHVISEALEQHRAWRTHLSDFLAMDEAEQVTKVQSAINNFYADDSVNPYVPAAARGPWIVTLKGAVLHDNGGYGALGFGHNPQAILEALSKPQVMANVMTPSVAQMRFDSTLDKELRTNRHTNPYTRFMCLNSGSESMTLAARIADVHAKMMTDTNEGQTVKRLVVAGAFHGRTGEPAIISHSSRSEYKRNLASFRHEDSLLSVEPYDVEQLKKVFAESEAKGWFIEAMYLEPVMGEGDPGRAATPEFYAAARELTHKHGSLLIVDSIQAGLRTNGVLSITSYPGFEKLEAPDMETFSKAINAGQYPLSVLMLNDKAAALYRKGIYGNTMTANPRALDVATATLNQLTDGTRKNIVERGNEFVAKLNTLKSDLNGLITKVQGTGLLISCELAPQVKCYGAGSIEEYLRENGIGVIHGGANSLRFTPHFNVTSAEVDLVLSNVRKALTTMIPGSAPDHETTSERFSTVTSG